MYLEGNHSEKNKKNICPLVLRAIKNFLPDNNENYKINTKKRVNYNKKKIIPKKKKEKKIKIKRNKFLFKLEKPIKIKIKVNKEFINKNFFFMVFEFLEYKEMLKLRGISKNTNRIFLFLENKKFHDKMLKRKNKRNCSKKTNRFSDLYRDLTINYYSQRN